MTRSDSHFITVDGIDGAGKSTQIRRLEEWLLRRGLPCLMTRDPGSSEIGLRLREILLGSELSMHRRTEAMLFMASRCEMVETVIKPTLAAGTSVISDRFLLANVVYQSVGDHDGSSPPDLLWRLGDLANGGLRPDLTILLDLPADAAMRRINRPADRMESRGVDYLESVRQAFLEQLPRSSETTAVINADQDPGRVFDEILEVAEHYLSESV